MILICVLPSINFGLFLSIHLLAKYLSFSMLSKICDLVFSFANFSFCLKFSAIADGSILFFCKWGSCHLLCYFLFFFQCVLLHWCFSKGASWWLGLQRTGRFLVTSTWWFLWNSTRPWFIVILNIFGPIIHFLFLSKQLYQLFQTSHLHQALLLALDPHTHCAKILTI